MPRRILIPNAATRQSGRSSRPSGQASFVMRGGSTGSTLSRLPSKTCLVRFDNNKYSVMAKALGRPVEVHAYADRIVIRQDGEVVAEHRRSFGRGQTIYDPWHYVPVLARKPGALRN